MALPPPHPTPEKDLHTTLQCRFSSLYSYVRNLHLWHTKRKKLQDKPIIALKNLGNCMHKKQSLFLTESPGERKYASSFEV